MRAPPDDWQLQGVSEFEPAAWRALRQTDRSLLVTAGAGAGKTEFLAQKAAYLLQTGLCPAPQRILAISFKRDAARNLRERVARRCDTGDASRFDSFTFDGFTKSLLDRFRSGIPAAYRPEYDYEIYYINEREIDRFLKSNRFDDVAPRPFLAKLAVTKIGKFNRTSATAKAVATYWEAYTQQSKRNRISFPEINRLVEFLLRENPLLMKALRLTYPVVFLDEFQDTTSAQYDLLDTAFDGSRSVFTAVGDDKQKIMGWAGALDGAFDQFAEDYGANRITLRSNWRSHADLVRMQHALVQIIDGNAPPTEPRGERTVDGDVAAIWIASTEKEESDGVAHWIQKEISQRRIPAHEFAVLVRMRADQAMEELEAAFRSSGIRLRNTAATVGAFAIQDLLADDLALMVLRLLRLSVMQRSPQVWSQALEDQFVLNPIDLEDEAAAQRVHLRLEKFIRSNSKSLSQLRLATASARDVTQAALEFLEIPRLQSAFPMYRRESDFNRLREAFETHLENCMRGAQSWTEALDDFEGIGQVQLMTIHKSKGLEFHTMIFYGLDNNSWWSLTRSKPEELNTFYVAFTRAKQRAFFTYCKARGQPVQWIEDLLEPAGVRRIAMSSFSDMRK